ncbi:MAG: AraC family transcriptional regulator [Pirellula sp.]|nr:AraC family transcriptional regulator [Pirellula sp.]
MTAYQEFEASSEIARFVECFWTSVSLQPTNIQVVPDACVDVVIKMPKDGGLQLDLVGAMTRPKSVAVSMGQQFLGIRFRPGMASSFVHGNLDELTDRTIPAQIWFGNVADSIARKIVRCEDVRERLDLLQPLLKSPRTPSPVQTAIEKLTSTHGKTTIEEMCDIAHLGERHLRRCCQAASGLSPKRLSSILRFRRAKQLIDQGFDLAATAVEAGYYDQPHFTREFLRYAKAPPSVAARKSLKKID